MLVATLLIKNVKVLGGDKKTEQSSCVFVSGEKISAIGNFLSKGADEIIDGQGAYLSPGFIDVNTDSDHYLTLFDNPGQEDFLRQGVTTIIGGQCGSSLAPLLYGTLESVRKWSDTDKINVNWHTLEEFLNVLEKKRLGVNFGTLVGHSTIRRALAGESLRNLTKNEAAVFAETLRRALSEGGFGFSTGLGYLHSRQTSYQEIKFLSQIVKNYNGVYGTHLRKSGVELDESVDETIRLAEETGVKTLISHFLPHRGEEKKYEESLAKFSNLPKEFDFHFDVYPFDESILPLYTFLPFWAQRENLEKMKKDIEDDWLRRKIIKDLPSVNPRDLVVAQAVKNDYLIGRTLEDLMEFYSLKNGRQALLQLMLVTGLRAVVFYKNINADLLLDALRHPRSLLATNSASFGQLRRMLKPERSFSTFTKFLSLVQKEDILTLQEAIDKITIVPARKFNVRNRGQIKEGNFADLVVFRNSEIKSVLVNGQVVLRDGEIQNVLAGKILRHG